MENSQTYWIAGVGVIILGLAFGLFYMSGDGPQVKNKTQTKTMETKTTTAVVTDTAVLKTSKGEITVELYGKDAPKTVENFLKLSKEGFYAGTRFHRVIKGFMIQGGDPLSKDDAQSARWGTGGPGYQFADEFNANKLVKGTLAMANSGPNTNGSQFFIVTAMDTPWLDGKHTAFGKVVKGMEIVDAIETAQTGQGDRPVEAITIQSIESL